MWNHIPPGYLTITLPKMRTNIIPISVAPQAKSPKVAKGKSEHTFDVNGRKFTIFLKGKFWQINCMIAKKLLKRSLKRSSHVAAEKVARELIIQALAGCWTEIEKRRSRTNFGTTFGQVFAAAPEISRASAKAVQVYVNQSREALARLFPDRDPESIRLEELPGGAANIVEKRMIAEYHANGNRSRSKQYDSAKAAAVGAARSAGIITRSIQWLFKSKVGSVRVPLVPEYEARGLAIPPNITAFLELDIDRHYNTIEYKPIADEIWDKIIPGIEQFNVDGWQPTRVAKPFMGYGLVAPRRKRNYYSGLILKPDGNTTQWSTGEVDSAAAQAVVEGWIAEGRCYPVNAERRRATLEFVKSRDLYKIFCCAIGGGLRREEIARLDHDHFLEDEHVGLYVEGGIGKGGKPISVRIQEHWAKKLRPLIKPGCGLFIDGVDTDYYRYSRVVTWLQEWIVETAKPLTWTADKFLHELRAYTGSKIYKKDPFAACEFMRHGDVKVTKKFYWRYDKEKRVVDVY